MNKPLNEYNIGDQVIVILKWEDASHEDNQSKDVEGVVVDIGTYVENYIGQKIVLPKVKVKYLRTYWDSSNKKTYEKENEEWFYYDSNIKLKNIPEE